MMTTLSDGTKLDLSRLTDEEARHVYQVVQRDFSLRKKEEERLGDLKTKIVKEDSKRELLGYQSTLSDSLCIHCLRPFKFLLNTKHQCLDCKFFVCKACSRFNKKDNGWVCDPCQSARLLKIGTLEWFHENVRSRFKRFGSAKVMKSLYKRLSEERTFSQPDLREDDTYCLPDVHRHSLCSQEDEQSDHVGRDHYRLNKKGKRLLLVDPQDFKLGTDHSIHPYRHSFKNERPDPEEDWTTVCRQILERRRDGLEERKKGIHHSSRSLDKPFHFDDCTYPENKMVRACSLSKMSHSSAGSANYGAFRELPYSVEDSEEDDADSYQNYLPSEPLNWEYSPDGVPPQITELNKRMSAIETLLGRLEQKITVPNHPLSLLEQTQPAEEALSQADQEELELKKKLEELTENISDKSSDEEEMIRLKDDVKPLGGSSRECSLITRKETAALDKDSFTSDEQKRRSSCELSQLESRVALTVASVQSTKSGVTDIQNRIAVLSATAEEKPWKKAPLSCERRMSHEFPIRARHTMGSLRKLSII
ncbi:melanophilin-like [Astyanax mexicanus]|uniref:Melanophilin-like n=2 Tax=Astyanax mexicanus TaxID=7994 RepID=A0A8T2LKE2_ASTMX|nr:melanophilin-like [Astyanax mexicanus]